VLPNVQVGRACIVGAGAVVRESIPDGAVMAGNPARPIRNDEEPRGI
jgi:acetyltransferase-like isoleucine patch superfamily enzyme